MPAHHHRRGCLTQRTLAWSGVRVRWRRSCGRSVTGTAKTPPSNRPVSVPLRVLLVTLVSRVVKVSSASLSVCVLTLLRMAGWLMATWSMTESDMGRTKPMFSSAGLTFQSQKPWLGSPSCARQTVRLSSLSALAHWVTSMSKWRRGPSRVSFEATRWPFHLTSAR